MPRYDDETRRMKRLASDPMTLVFYSRHATVRMAERGISKVAVSKVLRAGWVVSVETPLGRDERWRARGHDVDGRAIEVVIVPRE